MLTEPTHPDSPGIELAPGIWLPPAELRFKYSRSGGPGGQNVNKVNTKAELRIRPESLRGLSDRAHARLRMAAANRITIEGELLISSDSERSQEGNRQACLQRLRMLLLSILKEPKVRKKGKPSRGSNERRLESKKAHSKIKKERLSRFE